MPVKRRRSKQRHFDLDNNQYWDLRLGELTNRPAFKNQRDRRAAWDANRDQLMAHRRAGSRPAAWWSYDSPERRDESQDEALQLIRLGLCDATELVEIKENWAIHQATAVRFLKHQTELGHPERGRSEYHARREWAGIPSWFPEDAPAVPQPEPGWIEREEAATKVRKTAGRASNGHG